MQRRRNPEVIAGRVNADGSIAAGDGFTVQKTGTGTYTVRCPGLRLISASVTPNGATASAMANTITGDSFNAVPTTSAVVAMDAPFTFVAVGVAQ